MVLPTIKPLTQCSCAQCYAGRMWKAMGNGQGPIQERQANFWWLPTAFLSTHFHKYGDVCWERDGAQIEARRRVDVGTSARRSNKKMGPSRPNPSGGWGLRAISLSLVVVDVPASTPPLFATSPRKPHPQTLPYLGKGVLSYGNRRSCRPQW